MIVLLAVFLGLRQQQEACQGTRSLLQKKIKQHANILTMAVGLITHPEQANQIIESGKADLVAVAREALFNPMWAAQAAQHLNQDKQFTLWPKQSGWWLERREKSSEFYSPELNSD